MPKAPPTFYSHSVISWMHAIKVTQMYKIILSSLVLIFANFISEAVLAADVYLIINGFGNISEVPMQTIGGLAPVSSSFSTQKAGQYFKKYDPDGKTIILNVTSAKDLSNQLKNLSWVEGDSIVYFQYASHGTSESGKVILSAGKDPLVFSSIGIEEGEFSAKKIFSPLRNKFAPQVFLNIDACSCLSGDDLESSNKAKIIFEGLKVADGVLAGNTTLVLPPHQTRVDSKPSVGLRPFQYQYF